MNHVIIVKTYADLETKDFGRVPCYSITQATMLAMHTVQSCGAARAEVEIPGEGAFNITFTKEAS